MSRKGHDPAFPVCYQHKDEVGEIETTCEHWGMSLRDWFAGQALAGRTCDAHPQWLVKQAYDIADAMLAEREKKGEE